MIGQALKGIALAIAAIIIVIVLLIALGISFITLGTMTVIGMIIRGVGLLILVGAKKIKLCLGLLAIGFIIFLVSYLGLL